MVHSTSSSQSTSAFQCLHGETCHVFVICHFLQQDLDIKALEDCKRLHATFTTQLLSLRVIAALSKYPMWKISPQVEDPLDSSPPCQAEQLLKALLISLNPMTSLIPNCAQIQQMSLGRKTLLILDHPKVLTFLKF